MSGWKRVREPEDGQAVEYRYKFPKGWRYYTGVFLAHGPNGKGFYNEARTTKMARFRPAESRINWREVSA